MLSISAKTKCMSKYQGGTFASHPQCGGGRKLLFDESFIFDISSFAVDTGEKNISDTSHFNDFVSSSNFFEQCIFSLTSKHSLQNLKMQTFVYSFIYCLGSTSANSICESAKCAFLYLEVYVDMTLRAVLFFFLRRKQILSIL